MGNTSTEELERKLQILRQLTGGKAFAVRDLPSNICDRLDYSSKEAIYMFLDALAAGTSRCGRQLTKIGSGRYAWVNPSKEAVEVVAQVVSPHHIARDLTSDEVAALDMVQEVLVRSQDGAIRLTPKMVAMEEDEFVEFMEKMEAVRAALKIGANSQSAGGHVWGIARDKFSAFYQTAKTVKSGEYFFPPEPPLPPEVQISPAEERLADLCHEMAKELSQSAARIKQLEEELAQAKATHSEEDRRYKVFRSELDAMRRLAKLPNR